MNASVIGIIGAGNLGRSVARIATAAGLTVVLANSRGPESLTESVAALGSLASADTVEGAISRADIVVLALPYGAGVRLAPELLSGKIVVDATNHYAERDGQFDALASGAGASSALIAEQISSARVVKALNNVDFLRLTMLPREAGSAERTALPIAGDDAAAKSTVAGFLDTIGFDALDLGDLAESWRSEPNTPVYVTPYFRMSTEAGIDPAQRFVGATPVPVPAAQVRELVAAAQR